MCGRFTYAKEFRELRIRFNLDRDIPLFRPRYNIAPGQEVAVIFNRDGARGLAMMQWGLVPAWVKDPAIDNRMINARAETLAEKPAKLLSLLRPYPPRLMEAYDVSNPGQLPAQRPAAVHRRANIRHQA